MILTFLSLNMIFIQFVPPFLAVNKYLYFYVILFLKYFQMMNSTHLSSWQVSKAQTRATHLLVQCS